MLIRFVLGSLFFILQSIILCYLAFFIIVGLGDWYVAIKIILGERFKA